MFCLLHILVTMYLKIPSVSFILDMIIFQRTLNTLTLQVIHQGGPFLMALWVCVRMWPAPDRGREVPGASKTFVWKTEAKGMPLAYLNRAWVLLILSQRLRR